MMIGQQASLAPFVGLAFSSRLYLIKFRASFFHLSSPSIVLQTLFLVSHILPTAAQFPRLWTTYTHICIGKPCHSPYTHPSRTYRCFLRLIGLLRERTRDCASSLSVFLLYTCEPWATTASLIWKHEWQKNSALGDDDWCFKRKVDTVRSWFVQKPFCRKEGRRKKKRFVALGFITFHGESRMRVSGTELVFILSCCRHDLLPSCLKLRLLLSAILSLSLWYSTTGLS
jgi:hypothetical protein